MEKMSKQKNHAWTGGKKKEKKSTEYEGQDGLVGLVVGQKRVIAQFDGFAVHETAFEGKAEKGRARDHVGDREDHVGPTADTRAHIDAYRRTRAPLFFF